MCNVGADEHTVTPSEHRRARRIFTRRENRPAHSPALHDGGGSRPLTGLPPQHRLPLHQPRHDATRPQRHHLLWWFEAFGREHILEATGLSQDGSWVYVGHGPDIIATIGSNEGWDDAEIWTEWTKFLDTYEGRATAASIAELKSQAATAKE